MVIVPRSRDVDRSLHQPNSQLEDGEVGEEVVLSVLDLLGEVVLHEAEVGRVIPVWLSVAAQHDTTPNSPTPWMSSWMTSVREAGVCHSLRSWTGTGVEEVAILRCVVGVWRLLGGVESIDALELAGRHSPGSTLIVRRPPGENGSRTCTPHVPYQNQQSTLHVFQSPRGETRLGVHRTRSTGQRYASSTTLSPLLTLDPRHTLDNTDTDTLSDTSAPTSPTQRTQ